jgi:predicted membrane protein
MISEFGHGVGLLGMIMVVVAFFMTVEGKWSSEGLKFNICNLIGAILLLISLCIHFNLGSFIIEVFWIAISLRGLWRYYEPLAKNS